MTAEAVPADARPLATIRPHYGRNKRPQGWYVGADGKVVSHRLNTRQEARQWAEVNGYRWR